VIREHEHEHEPVQTNVKNPTSDHDNLAAPISGKALGFLKDKKPSTTKKTPKNNRSMTQKKISTGKNKKRTIPPSSSSLPSLPFFHFGKSEAVQPGPAKTKTKRKLSPPLSPFPKKRQTKTNADDVFIA